MSQISGQIFNCSRVTQKKSKLLEKNAHNDNDTNSCCSAVCDTYWKGNTNFSFLGSVWISLVGDKQNNKNNNNNNMFQGLPLARHENNSSPTGHLIYRGNSYCEVQDTVFDLDHNVIVKASKPLAGASRRTLIYNSTICEDYGKYF